MLETIVHIALLLFELWIIAFVIRFIAVMLGFLPPSHTSMLSVLKQLVRCFGRGG